MKSLMTYRQAVEQLYALGNEVSTAKLGLDRIRLLLRRLGDPQSACSYVHVAGTNGKGSVSAMVEAGLRTTGVRTGLFTSPHLVEPAERIQIFGEPVSGDEFAAAFDEVQDAAARMMAGGELDLHPTYFESVTAMAFLVFRARGVETAVMEVGLGGRLDATNVIMPRLCVITPIDYDHQNYLGDRIEQIAAAAEQITASASSMQHSVGEVATVAEQSSAASQEVSASTEQTSASAQEIAASAHELANHAAQLNRLVARFQINDSGSGSVSDVLGSALEAHQAWRTRLLEAIETGKSPMSVQEAGHDDRCNFGKWLHGPGTLRDRDPRRWQQLHDLHEQFHCNAAEVLELAISGRATEAEERMQASEFVKIERQLQGALQTAAVS